VVGLFAGGLGSVVWWMMACMSENAEVLVVLMYRS
jgi:hypothetical protein